MFGRGQHHEESGRTTPIFYLESYYKKTGEYFSMIPFATSRLWSKNIFENFFEHAGPPEREWQGHTHFYLENYYKKTDKYFSTIPFASSWLCSKTFLKILSSMVSHLKGSGRVTPIFNLENYYKKTDE